MPEYGMAPDGGAAGLDRIAAAAARLGRRQLAQGAGVSPRTLSSILDRGAKATSYLPAAAELDFGKGGE